MTNLASFVADEAAAAVRVAAGEIGSSADAIAGDAADLVYAPARLAGELRAAIAAVPDIDRLVDLAVTALSDLPAVPTTTANRRGQATNQAALVALVRGLATVALASRVGTTTYRDRTALLEARDIVADAIDARAASADTDTFRALRALRAVIVQLSDAQLRTLPRVITASPGVVRPSLVLAYSIYEDIGRADEIVGRNQLPRPGFVPGRPIEVLSE